MKILNEQMLTPQSFKHNLIEKANKPIIFFNQAYYL